MTRPTMWGIVCLSILKEVKVNRVEKAKEGVQSNFQIVLHTGTDVLGTPALYFC